MRIKGSFKWDDRTEPFDVETEEHQMSARKRCDAGECGRMDWEARIAKLEAALRAITAEMEIAHDGAHIFTVRDICAKALSR